MTTIARTVFDIETAPLSAEEIEAIVPPFDPAEVKTGNIKDPAKVAAKIEECRASYMADIIERAALSPVTGKVIAIGYIVNGEPMLRIDPEHEQSLLIEFWELVRTQWSATLFIGHNIRKFDLKFIEKRSWKWGVPIPPGVRRGRYWDDCFVDTMELWSHGDTDDRISLDNLGKFLGIGCKAGNGADFHKIDRAAQEAYLTKDLELTAKAAAIMLPTTP